MRYFDGTLHRVSNCALPPECVRNFPRLGFPVVPRNPEQVWEIKQEREATAERTRPCEAHLNCVKCSDFVNHCVEFTVITVFIKRAIFAVCH